MSNLWEENKVVHNSKIGGLISMSTAEIVIRATFKFAVIWTSLAAVGLPLAKLGIEFAYEIWRKRV